MRWILQKLVGAVVAGVGWKLGADAYDAIKKHIKERNGGGEEEEGAAATQTHVDDVDGHRGDRP
jgi:hypothetical protein